MESDEVDEGEEAKSDGALQDDADDFSCLPTKALFKKAGEILAIIQERLRAKEAQVRDRLTAELREPEMVEEFHVRHLYSTYGGSHLSMSRMPTDHFNTSNSPSKIFASNQIATMEKIGPESRFIIDYLFAEQKRVKVHMSSVAEVIQTLLEISLPASLTINECDAQIHLVEESLTIRSRKLLKRPRWMTTP